ncbi:MAG: hypothetical protein FJW66_04445 [Actinobacteria bacterium]|nr:hypothetical protein [Actinomycetota bacterium]
MNDKVREIGGLSRKARINIFIGIFLIFIIISVLTSINQISNIVRNREKVIELEEMLNYERDRNIKLLAEEKTLYDDEAIEIEARNQFNMTKGEETNYFIEIVKDSEKEDSAENSDSSSTSSLSSGGNNSGTYEKSNLWENIRIFYNNEIKEK